MLNFSLLKTKLEQGFASHNNTPLQAAANLSDAFESYIRTISNLGSGTFITMTGTPLLKNQLTNIFAQRKASKLNIANSISVEINKCFMTLVTTYQTGNPKPTGFSSFQSSLSNLLGQSQPSGIVFAQKLANHINTYVKQCQIQGVIPGTPPVLFNGPPR